MNKRGIAKIIEATIAIVIVIGAILLLSSQRQSEQGRNLNEIIPPLLDEIAKQPELREQIIASDNAAAADIVMDFLNARVINPSLEYLVLVCSLAEPCLPQNAIDTGGEIFVSERVISSSLAQPGATPKKIRIFLWRAG